MSLRSEMDRLTQDISIHLPPALLKEGLEARRRLVENESGNPPKAIEVGDQAPVFSLPNVRGETVTLEALRKKGPIILNFYRGGWCDYCNLELRALQKVLEKSQQTIDRMGATLVAVSPQTREHSLSTVKKNKLTFEVLSDAGNDVARQYGLVFALDDKARHFHMQVGAVLPEYNGDQSWELPHPGTFVINRDGIIAWAFVNADYTRRSEPEEVFAALKELA